MKCLFLSLCILSSEKLYCCRLWRCCKSKHGNIRLFSLFGNLVNNHIFRIIYQFISISERHCHRCHILTCSGRMSLIYNNCKLFIFQPPYTVNNVREFLYCSGDNFRISLNRKRKVIGITPFIHHTNHPCLMFNSHYCLLELPVHHYPVRTNNNIIKYDFILLIMQRCQSVRQPCNGIGLARTSGMLYQIILAGTRCRHLCQRLSDDIQLMISWKNNRFRAFHFICQRVFLFLDLNEHKFANYLNQHVFLQNVFPHIIYAVLTFINRIPCSCINSLSLSHIKRQEER